MGVARFWRAAAAVPVEPDSLYIFADAEEPLMYQLFRKRLVRVPNVLKAKVQVTTPPLWLEDPRKRQLLRKTVLMMVYSAVLGVFVPSGGSKWVIEAPYVMEAAHTLHTHLGWVVSAYDLGEALANLVQPFWMLPILGLFRLAARDVMGYTLVVFFALVPVVLVLVTLLGLTLRYPL